jgi:hypothetical protein
LQRIEKHSEQQINNKHCLAACCNPGFIHPLALQSSSKVSLDDMTISMADEQEGRVLWSLVLRRKDELEHSICFGTDERD